MKENYSFTSTLLKGLMVILPVAVIGATVFWLLHALEGGLAWMLRLILPARLYYPGVGVVVGLFLIYLVGMLMNTRAAQKLSNHWDRLLNRIPLIKSLYGAVQDIVKFVSSDTKKMFNKVVSVTLNDSEIRLIGFVTQENLVSIPEVNETSDMLVVYLPMSYQIGGYMVLVPRSAVQLIDMSIEDASRLVFTSGMSIHKSNFVAGHKNGQPVKSIASVLTRSL